MANIAQLAGQNLPDPVDGSIQRSETEVADEQVMANGSVQAQVVAYRFEWNYTWDVDAADRAILRAAYASARFAVATWKPVDEAVNYANCRTLEWAERPYKDGSVIRWEISFKVKQLTGQVV